MIEDGLLIYSNAQAITATAVSTNVLDFGAVMDLGVTERPTEVFVNWNVAPVFSVPGTTTLTIQLQSAPAATGPWTTVDQTGPLTVIPAGTTNPLDLTPGMQRFTQLNYVVTGGSLTAGTVTSGLVLDADGGQRYYKRGYSA
jgi:hypothetical protein